MGEIDLQEQFESNARIERIAELEKYIRDLEIQIVKYDGSLRTRGENDLNYARKELAKLTSERDALL